MIMNSHFWGLAVFLSLFWGIYGCNSVKDKKIKLIDFMKNDPLEVLGIFLSEFIGSLAGWYCFSLLLPRIKYPNLGIFEVLLGTIAVIGISGYSYKLIDKIGK